jgi:hypothetical protein
MKTILKKTQLYPRHAKDDLIKQSNLFKPWLSWTQETQLQATSTERNTRTCPSMFVVAIPFLSIPQMILSTYFTAQCPPQMRQMRQIERRQPKMVYSPSISHRN